MPGGRRPILIAIVTGLGAGAGRGRHVGPPILLLVLVIPSVRLRGRRSVGLRKIEKRRGGGVSWRVKRAMFE